MRAEACSVRGATEAAINVFNLMTDTKSMGDYVGERRPAAVKIKDYDKVQKEIARRHSLSSSLMTPFEVR